MKLTYGAYRMELQIDSYEFPYYEHNTYEDNNWLNVRVQWEDDVIMEEGISPSMTTKELQDLYQGLSKALAGNCYASSFQEPDLSIVVEPKDTKIRFYMAYTKPGRTTLSIDALITKAQLDAMISDVHAMCIAFPQRKNTMLN